MGDCIVYTPHGLSMDTCIVHPLYSGGGGESLWMVGPIYWFSSSPPFLDTLFFMFVFTYG
jgi:hypothetical protein